jgi:hypothetical protein
MVKNWSFLLFFNFHVGAAAPTPMTIPPPMGEAAPPSGAGGVRPSRAARASGVVPPAEARNAERACDTGRVRE